MTNEQVINAWLKGKVGAAGNLSTDGRKLYSYQLCIGHVETCELNGRPIRRVRDYTSGGLGFISQTTSCHVGLAKRLTKDIWCGTL